MRWGSSARDGVRDTATPAAPNPSGGYMTLVLGIVVVVALAGVGAALLYIRSKK